MPRNKRGRKKKKEKERERGERRTTFGRFDCDERRVFAVPLSICIRGSWPTYLLTIDHFSSYSSCHRFTAPIVFGRDSAAFRYFPHPLPSNERTHERGDILRAEKSAFLNGARSRLRFAVKLPKAKNNELATWCRNEERWNCGLLFVTVFRIVRNDSPRAVMHQMEARVRTYSRGGVATRRTEVIECTNSGWDARVCGNGTRCSSQKIELIYWQFVFWLEYARRIRVAGNKLM